MVEITVEISEYLDNALTWMHDSTVSELRGNNQRLLIPLQKIADQGILQTSVTANRLHW